MVGFLQNAHPAHEVCGIESEMDFDVFVRGANPCLLLMDHEFYQTMRASELDAMKRHKLFVLMDLNAPRGKILHESVSGIISTNVPLRVISENIEMRISEPEPVRPFAYMEKTPEQRTIEDIGLTKREKQVLRHIIKGNGNKEIARLMELEIVTIKLHVRNLCKKLSVSNRTQAAIFVFQNGWDKEL